MCSCVSVVDEQRGYCRLVDTSTVSAQRRGWWSLFSYASVRGLYPMFAKEWKCVRARKKVSTLFCCLPCAPPLYRKGRDWAKARFDLDPLPPPRKTLLQFFFVAFVGWYWTAKGINFRGPSFALSSSFVKKRILKGTRSFIPPPFTFISFLPSSSLFTLHSSSLLSLLSFTHHLLLLSHPSLYSPSSLLFIYQSFLICWKKISSLL